MGEVEGTIGDIPAHPWDKCSTFTKDWVLRDETLVGNEEALYRAIRARMSD